MSISYILYPISDIRYPISFNLISLWVVNRFFTVSPTPKNMSACDQCNGEGIPFFEWTSGVWLEGRYLSIRSSIHRFRKVLKVISSTVYLSIDTIQIRRYSPQSLLDLSAALFQLLLGRNPRYSTPPRYDNGSCRSGVFVFAEN